MANVLVADDNRSIQVLFGKNIEHMGHQVFYANDGKQALDIASIEQLDIIVLDYEMPVLTGDIALSRLREMPQGKDVKVILVSAAYTLQHLPNLHEADMVLFKPITGKELRQTITELL
jgi:CheY-like chemotaxis protein